MKIQKNRTLLFIGIILALGTVLVVSFMVSRRFFLSPRGLPGEKGMGIASDQVIKEISQIDWQASVSPQVVLTRPSGGEVLPQSGELELKFDQPMEATSIQKAWRMESLDGQKVEGNFIWLDPQTLQFTPSKKLETDAAYKVTISEEAKSASGESLQDPMTFEFQTAGDLQINQVFPPDGAKSVAVNAVITAIFNRPVVPLKIVEEQGELPDPLIISPTLKGEGEWVSTSVYAFHPDRVLKGATEYTIGIKAGLSDAVKSSTLTKDFSWQFETIPPRIGDLQLSRGVINPSNGQKDILIDESFSISFYQPMNRDSAEKALSLTNNGGESVLLTTNWNEDLTQIMITPTVRLALGTDYILKIENIALAADGSRLEKGLDWSFTTINPPGVQFTSPADGVRQDVYASEFYIKFVSPMRIDTVKDRILIEPTPKNKVEWWYNEWEWIISTYSLDPSTNYTIHLLPGMEDIYGNKTSTEKVVRFTTAKVSSQAYLQMPYMPSMFRIGSDELPHEFFAAYRNVRSVSFQLYRLTPKKFLEIQSGQVSQWEYSPPEGDLVWKFEEQSKGQLDELVLNKYQMAGKNGEALSPGLYFLAMDSPEVVHSGPFADTRLIVLANINLTYKGTNTEALVWATGLNDGKPIDGVPLTVYDNKFQSIGQGKTDQDGLLYLNVPPPKETYEPRYVMSESGDYFAFVSSEWGSGVSLYDYGIWSDYYSPANRPTAYIYTDRPIYRPGQPVYFKGIVRLDDDLAYRLPEQKEIHVVVRSYEEVISEQTLKLSPFGSFSGEINLDREAALGYYTISAYFTLAEGDVGGVGFNVAEYRKPEFIVNAEASPKDVLTGSLFDVDISAEYYSGGAVSGATVQWTLVSSPYFFGSIDELSRYSFIDNEVDTSWYNPPEPYDSKVVAEGKGTLDENGRLTLTLPTSLSGSRSRTFNFEATVTDLSNNAVSGRDSVIVHQSSIYGGIRPLSYVGEEGEAQKFEVIVVDWDGNPVSGQKVRVDVVERRWYSVQEQDAQGRIKWTSSVEEIPVESFDDLVADGNGLATVEFIPPNGGIFRARVSAMDDSGNETHASAFMWVAGKENIPWQQTNDRGFKLVADKTSYDPGETAEILIASPFQGATYALVTVERGHIRHREVIRLTSNSTIYKLPVTADLAPNIFVSVVIVKGVDETNPRPDFKMGMAELTVDTKEQNLHVEVTSDHQQAGPGEDVVYTVITKDAKDQPVDAEVSLSLTDLATLSLSEPNSRPILDHFYSFRTLNVWTSIPIVLSIEDYNASITENLIQGEAMGSGGGKGGGEFGVFEVREEFPDTAYWNATLETGVDGQAIVTVTLPDNLTTWRMDARAISMDTRVGQTTQDIVSSKPLLVRPQTPRFFVAGDEASLGAAIHNNTDQPLKVRVSLAGEGVAISTEAQQELEIPANQQDYVTWEVKVGMDASRVDLVFSVEGGGYSDASRPTVGTLDGQGIPVYRFEAKETVGTSGMMTEGGSRVEAISLPEAFKVRNGELKVEVAPSLTAGMTEGLNYLEHFPYECVEQTISRFLPNVVTRQALRAAGLTDVELENNLEIQVNTALQRLYNWQNPDGGWGWWSRNESDPQTTAYVILGMIEAKEAGYTVSEQVVNRGIDFLKGHLSPKSRLNETSARNRQAFILYILAKAGQPEISKSVQLFEDRLGMSYFARAFLAETLFLIDAQDERINTLLSDFSSTAIVSSSGTHWEEEQRDLWSWNTNTRTTAIILSVVSQIDPENPLNANAVRWLMSNRSKGHWLGTQETAWTLMALTNWMVASGEMQADYSYAVALNGKELGANTVTHDSLQEMLNLRVDIKDLLGDQVNRLAFVRDQGEGNLYYSAYLDVSLPVEEIEALDRGIIVSRSYYPVGENKKATTMTKVGDLVLARLTLVVPHDLHYVVVDDPLPAGLEAVDQSLKVSPQNEIPESYRWEDLMSSGWGWWWFDHVELRDEKVILSADYLPAGTYVYSYLVRAMTPGVFRTIPPVAQEFYFPDVYGRGEGGLFTITP